jgi:hypothetical protein
MRRFLYFLPGHPGANAALLGKLGLLDRFSDDGSTLIDHCIIAETGGPAGEDVGAQAGCIIAAGIERPTYARDTQRWIDCDNFWVAIEDLPPLPQDLERARGIAGYDLPLGPEGQIWRVPLVLAWNRQAMRHDPHVPTHLAFEKGKVVHRISRRHQPIVDVAQRVLDAALAAYTEQRDVVLPNGFEAAARLLGVNYRIGVEELSLLEAIDEPAAQRILSLSIDLGAFIEHGQELSQNGVQYAADPYSVEGE